jgi:hypothetical protein
LFTLASFESIKAGARLRGSDASGVAEIVQVSKFRPDALNLIFRVNGRVSERLVFRGEEVAVEVLSRAEPMPSARPEVASAEVVDIPGSAGVEG